MPTFDLKNEVELKKANTKYDFENVYSKPVVDKVRPVASIRPAEAHCPVVGVFFRYNYPIVYHKMQVEDVFLSRGSKII
jgi:hypothetical protein